MELIAALIGGFCIVVSCIFSFGDRQWITLYQCRCDEYIENGVGKWDDKLFCKMRIVKLTSCI